MVNIEAIAEQYARRWIAEGPQDLLVEFSSQVVKNRVDNPKQAQRLYWKLACEDLTRRWESRLRTESYDLAPQAKVEDYLRLLRTAAKTIAPLSRIRAWQIPVAVMEIEMRARWSVGQRVPAEDFRRRFGQLSDENLRPLEQLAIQLATRTLPPSATVRKKLDKEAFDFLKSVPIRNFAKQLVRAGLVSVVEINSSVEELPRSSKSAISLAQMLSSKDRLTPFQAQAVTNDGDCPLVLGDYVVRDKLGEGGMGTVYRAEHRRMGREVALKLISKSNPGEQFVVRFQREVKVAARLTHENIVRAYDAGEHDGQHYLVMELVDGIDLASLVAQTGRLSPRTAVEYTLQIARGLAYAHQQDVIHRDVKPSNVLLAEDGTLKVLDMGLARIDDARSTRLTTAGNRFMGTAEYTAPEQALDPASADVRSDIYSLGCTLYFLVCARSVYEGRSLAAQFRAHRDEQIPQLAVHHPRAGPLLQGVFERMLAKKPSDRYSSMQEVIVCLERLLDVDQRKKESRARNRVAEHALAASSQSLDKRSNADHRSKSDSSAGDGSDNHVDRITPPDDTKPAGRVEDTQIESDRVDAPSSEVRRTSGTRVFMFTTCIFLFAFFAIAGSMLSLTEIRTIGGQFKNWFDPPTPLPDQLNGIAKRYADHIREGTFEYSSEQLDKVRSVSEDEESPKIVQVLSNAILAEYLAVQSLVQDKVAEKMDVDVLTKLEREGHLPTGYISFLRGVIAWHQQDNRAVSDRLQDFERQDGPGNARDGLGLRRRQWAAQILLDHATDVSGVPDNNLTTLRYQESALGRKEVERAGWWLNRLDQAAARELWQDLAFHRMLVRMASEPGSKGDIATDLLRGESPLHERLEAAMTVGERESATVGERKPPAPNDSQFYKAIFECASAAIDQRKETDSEQARKEVQIYCISAYAITKLADSENELVASENETVRLETARLAAITLLGMQDRQPLLSWSESGWTITDDIEDTRYCIGALFLQHYRTKDLPKTTPEESLNLEMIAAALANFEEIPDKNRVLWFTNAETHARKSNDDGVPPKVPNALKRAARYAQQANNWRPE